MVAYILNCAALRSACCLASPSGNCFASLARASACSSRWSAVKNATLFLLRMPGLISVSKNSCQNHSMGSDCDGLDATCVCWMWPQRVQRSVQCSYPAREGVMRCTTLTPRQ
jgi:hypothetical protein